jgi:hypothetical protein
MTSKCKILIIIIITLFFIAPKPKAICTDPTDCYCFLLPQECSVLVYAEVTESSTDHVSLRILEEPYVDPDNLFDSGQIIENLEFEPFDQSDLVFGVFGLFRIKPEGLCVEDGFDSEASIFFFVQDINGIYPCIYVPGFPGVTKADLLSAVLDDNCRTIVREWGVETKCGTSSGGCFSCNDQAMTAGHGLYFVFAGILLLPSRQKRRNR